MSATICFEATDMDGDIVRFYNWGDKIRMECDQPAALDEDEGQGEFDCWYYDFDFATGKAISKWLADQGPNPPAAAPVVATPPKKPPMSPPLDGWNWWNPITIGPQRHPTPQQIYG